MRGSDGKVFSDEWDYGKHMQKVYSSDDDNYIEKAVRDMMKMFESNPKASY
jgi:hypothetical protein